MARFLHSIHSFAVRRKQRVFLAFSWFLGLGAGGVIFRLSGEHISSLMPLAAASQLSIVSLFLWISLPFLLTAYAVYVSKPCILPVICFFRAFLYGYMLCGVFYAFGDSGWLIRWLLLFTDTCSCTLLYGFAAWHVSGLRGFSFRRLCICECLIGLLIFLDFSFVSPFLRQLLS